MIVLANEDQLGSLWTDKRQILLFLCLNLGVMVLQLVSYSLMLLRKTPAVLKVAVHMAMQGAVLFLLLWGSVITFNERREHFKNRNTEKVQQKLSEYKINFALTMMIWFRFIENFLCICIYLNALMILCTNHYERRGQQAYNRTNQVSIYDLQLAE